MNEEALAYIAAINKDAGANSVIVASELAIPKRFTSGSLAFDVALGGGWAGNQWAEVLGYEQSGKTAITLKTVAANQALDPDFSTFWLAAEHYDAEQATALGVDNSRVHVAPTQKMEVALDYILGAVETMAYDLTVCDSFPALIPSEESEKAMDEFVVATGAKLFNKFWRKAGESSYRDPHGGDRPFFGIFINQWRDKIGGFSPFGVPQTSPGGHGKDYAYYTRVDVKRKEFIGEMRPTHKKPVKVGQVIACETVKNKSAAPRQVAELDFYFRNAPALGFIRGEYDLGRECVDLGVLFSVVEKSGGWLTYGGEKYNGDLKMKEAVRADVDLKRALYSEVLEAAADPRRADHFEVDDAVRNANTRKVKRRRKDED